MSQAGKELLVLHGDTLMTREELLALCGDVTWCWGCSFFIETAQGNFEWSSPDYGGDNTLRPYAGTYQDFLKQCNVPYGRSKGKHILGKYCGEKVSLVDFEVVNEDLGVRYVYVPYKSTPLSTE